jgi:hypothetical protein
LGYYFWWKKHYEIKTQYNIKGRYLCDICQKLNEPIIFVRNQFYQDIKKWIGEGICREPSILF